MYHNYKEIFKGIVDTEAILAEAMQIGGDKPSGELVIALTIKAISNKLQIQVDELKAHVCVESPTLQDLENQGKLPGIISLDSVRNIRDANEALDESIELLDQQAELKANFDLERKHAAALNPEITLGDEYDSKDIYLETFSSPHNVRSVVGLHAIGHAGQYDYSFSDLTGCTTQHSTDFQSIEVWGNEYDSMNEKEQVMIGRGSFRVHTHDIDAEAKQWEAEGWKRIPNPWKKK